MKAFVFTVVWVLAAKEVAGQAVLDSLFADPVLSSLTAVFATATDPTIQASASSELASRVNGALSSANGAFASTGAADAQSSAPTSLGSANGDTSAASAQTPATGSGSLPTPQASSPSAPSGGSVQPSSDDSAVSSSLVQQPPVSPSGAASSSLGLQGPGAVSGNAPTLSNGDAQSGISSPTAGVPTPTAPGAISTPVVPNEAATAGPSTGPDGAIQQPNRPDFSPSAPSGDALTSLPGVSGAPPQTTGPPSLPNGAPSQPNGLVSAPPTTISAVVPNSLVNPDGSPASVGSALPSIPSVGLPPSPPVASEPNLPVGPNGAPSVIGFTPQVSLANAPQLSTDAEPLGSAAPASPAPASSDISAGGGPLSINSQPDSPEAGGEPSNSGSFSTPQITNRPQGPLASNLPDPLRGLAESFANNPGVQSISNLLATATDQNLRADLSAGISQVYQLYLSIVRSAAANGRVEGGPAPSGGANGRPFPAQPRGPPAADGSVPTVAVTNTETATEVGPAVTVTSTAGVITRTRIEPALSVTATAVASISDGTIETAATAAATAVRTLTEAANPGNQIVTPAPVPRAPEGPGPGAPGLQGAAGGNAGAAVSNSSGAGNVGAGGLNTDNSTRLRPSPSNGFGGQPLAPAPVPQPLATNYPNGNPNENPNGGNLSGNTFGGNLGPQGPGNGSSQGLGGGVGAGPAGASPSSGNVQGPLGPPSQEGGSSGGALGGSPGNASGPHGNATGTQPPLYANSAGNYSPITLSLALSLLITMFTI